jgi:hypothetical protein
VLPRYRLEAYATLHPAAAISKRLYERVPQLPTPILLLVCCFTGSNVVPFDMDELDQVIEGVARKKS